MASCDEGEQTNLELLVDPQKGFTSKLQRLARYEGGSDRSDFRLALFTGPHGASAPLGEFKRVLMVASGFGIVAQLPYLRQLIRGYNDFTTRTRRVRLVWQLENIGKCAGRQLMEQPTNDGRGRGTGARDFESGLEGRCTG